MITLVQSSLSLLTGIIMLSACDDFNRFKQEKYECNWNPAGILEIELRSIKVDANANILTIDGDRSGKLVFSDDKKLIIEGPNLIIRIDREESIIKATRGTRYHEMRCNKIEFKM